MCSWVLFLHWSFPFALSPLSIWLPPQGNLLPIGGAFGLLYAAICSIGPSVFLCFVSVPWFSSPAIAKLVGLICLDNPNQLVQPFLVARYTHYDIYLCLTVKFTSYHPNNLSYLHPVFL